MIRVIIVEPNITKEENERNLKRVEEVLTKIVRKASPKKLEKLRNNQL